MGPSRSDPSGTRERLGALTLPRLAAGAFALRSTLELLLLGPGSGDKTRAMGGSKLGVRFCSLRGPSGMFLGTAGTGGAQPAAEAGLLLLPGPGDGDLNVRSVIDPELILLCIALVGRLLAILATEAVEPRRAMRLV